LGIAELESALEAIQLGLAGTTLEELRQLLRMLWLTSREEISLFEPIFQRWIERVGEVEEVSRGRLRARDIRMTPNFMEESVARSGVDFGDSEKETLEEVPTVEPVRKKVPVQAQLGQEEAQVTLEEGKAEKGKYTHLRLIRQHDPISPLEARRLWQRLDIEEEILTKFQLDLPRTVRRIARQGYFDAPVLKPRRFRSLNLILLMDRGGSMVPTHDFCDRWRRTLEQSIRFRRIRTAYFHDTVRDNVFLDTQRNRPVPLHRLLRPFPPRQTAVLIVTDAGAARRNWDTDRIFQCENLSIRLRRSHFIQLWLNPFRQAYWEDNIAGEIARLVPRMLPMDADGTRAAIRYLNEQLKSLET